MIKAKSYFYNGRLIRFSAKGPHINFTDQARLPMDIFDLPEPKHYEKLSNYDLMLGTPIAPIDRMKLFSPGQYEDFIREWSIGFLRKNGKYTVCKKCSGSGDKGRDIIGVIDKNEWDNFQCKHYDHALAPTDIYIEIGKLIYYTFNKEYTIPKTYFFISPLGIGSKLNDLFDNPSTLRDELIKNWTGYCETKITTKKTTPLSKELLDYITSFDFSIFKGYDPQQIIEEHRETPYYACRFGGGLQKRRVTSPKTSVPTKIEAKELNYTNKLFSAYSDYKKTEIKTIKELEPDQELSAHFFRQREGFYSADSLYQFSRDTYPPEIDYFQNLKDEFYRGVIDVVNETYRDGYQRVKATTNFAKTLQISSNPLSFQVIMEDREGICHHLANEDKITWIRN